MSRHFWIVASALCAGILAVPAAAAPSSGEDAGSVGDEPAATTRPMRDLLPPSAGDQTLDRLMQLQPRTAGIEFKERPAAAPAAAKVGLPQGSMPAAAKPAQVPPQTPGGLFGSGAVPRPVTSTGTASGEPPWQLREMANRPASHGSGRSDDLPVHRWWLIPRAVLLYIRENRVWVIGSSVAALVLFWAGSSAFARRRTQPRG